MDLSESNMVTVTVMLALMLYQVHNIVSENVVMNNIIAAFHESVYKIFVHINLLCPNFIKEEK